MEISKKMKDNVIDIQDGTVCKIISSWLDIPLRSVLMKWKLHPHHLHKHYLDNDW